MDIVTGRQLGSLRKFTFTTDTSFNFPIDFTLTPIQHAHANVHGMGFRVIEAKHSFGGITERCLAFVIHSLHTGASQIMKTLIGMLLSSKLL